MTTMTKSSPASAEALRRTRSWTGLVWHTGSFLIINAFFWLLDLGFGQSGTQWAYWIAVPWGFALAFHGLSYYVDGRRIAAAKAARIDRELDQHQ